MIIDNFTGVAMWRRVGLYVDYYCVDFLIVGVCYGFCVRGFEELHFAKWLRLGVSSELAIVDADVLMSPICYGIRHHCANRILGEWYVDIRCRVATL